MASLPTELLWRCDQHKARADNAVDDMVRVLRQDIADGHDSTLLWWSMFNSCAGVPCADVAAGLAAALMRLAQRPPQPDED